MQVDPSVFRRFDREVVEEPEEEGAETYDDKRSQVKNYKMPRRKTTRRRRGPSSGATPLQHHTKAIDYYQSEDQTNEDNSDDILDLMDTRPPMPASTATALPLQVIFD